MIIIITGGIGSGKTLSIVKDIVSRKQPTFTNFDLMELPYNRLKYEHLIEKVVIPPEPPKRKEIVKEKLNFAFWKEQIKKGGFDIYLDEFHNVMNSRRSMSRKNVLISDWLSQIRKILGQTERNNLYLITQKLKRVDVNCRDLAHVAIKCQSYKFNNIPFPTEVWETQTTYDKEGEPVYTKKLVTKRLPLVVIRKLYFRDADKLHMFENYGTEEPYMDTQFIGNLYYKYYDSYELIDFGGEDYI